MSDNNENEPLSYDDGTWLCACLFWGGIVLTTVSSIVIFFNPVLGMAGDCLGVAAIAQGAIGMKEWNEKRGY